MTMQPITLDDAVAALQAANIAMLAMIARWQERAVAPGELRRLKAKGK